MGEKYDKIVRDKVPEKIRADGQTPVTRTATGDEYRRLLLDKIAEETEEFRESGAVEELADVLEVVEALREFEDISTEVLRQKRREKAEERGRFESGVVLQEVRSEQDE